MEDCLSGEEEKGFLKKKEKSGEVCWGEGRNAQNEYKGQGKKNSDGSLNIASFSLASLSYRSFGCGQSRKHELVKEMMSHF